MRRRAKLSAADGSPDVADALLEDARIWRDGVELMIGDLAGGDLLPGRVLLCGGGADLPQVRSVLDEDGWWQRLPFARRPKVRALAPDEVMGLRDATGSLGTRQDVTPMALAHQALILDAGSTAVDRAMRSDRAGDAAVSESPAVVYLEADDEITSVVRRVRAADAGARHRRRAGPLASDVERGRAAAAGSRRRGGRARGRASSATP